MGFLTSMYFGGVRLAALFNRKARMLSCGEKQALDHIASRIENGERYIWFHAASVGEFEQGRPIMEKIKQEHPQCKIILTFFSPSGYELRKNYAGADIVSYLPFATKKKVRKFLDLVNPVKAVFIKYEFWPNYLSELKRRHIPTYIIAAIFRRNQIFFKWYGAAYRRCLYTFEHLFVQDEESRKLLAKYKINDVTVCGDPRFDRVCAIAQEAKNLPIIEQFTYGAPTLIAGSTWPVDEDMLIRYVKENNYACKLVLVPHETDKRHLHHIYQALRGRYVRYTEATPRNVEMANCLVVDTVGILSSIYRYGTVAYIGGGFGVGIHNTLEAAVYGMPVVFGPNYHKFREARQLIECRGGFSVKNYKTLKKTLDEAFEHSKEYGENAKNYVQGNKGATDVIYNRIMK
ncbi:MAG: 3-deoxy-D-manno-octulosonic acid transferase [Bacteroidetes bacterium]|uniref:3-deoxy-D-manno-octulosonic acid transferase n=1 Tax=Candidatus Gallipaludibacter merdavium TaxID=2840839 RepID=A0A9D9HSU2_9BACT|nr:3-deoxy-D-manno-octulosonic acid transferase [Candidatus Gallipaludibacter merdavium]